MEKHIKEKLKYYETQVISNTDRFINTNKRLDRDRLIMNRERVKIYKELLKITEE